MESDYKSIIAVAVILVVAVVISALHRQAMLGTGATADTSSGSNVESV